MSKIDKKGKKFQLYLTESWYYNGDILEPDNTSSRIKVLEKPRRKKWQVFLQWITFGWYKAAWYYKVEFTDKK